MRGFFPSKHFEGQSVIERFITKFTKLFLIRPSGFKQPGGLLGLAGAGEEALPVAGHPHDALAGLKIRKVPGQLALHEGAAVGTAGFFQDAGDRAALGIQGPGRIEEGREIIPGGS